MTYTYPFTAFIGQDLMRLGLLLNAVNSKIGGMLIRGEKGTGKSTVVRALAAILPEIDVVEACPFQCNFHAADLMCPYCRKAEVLLPPTKSINLAERKLRTMPTGGTTPLCAGMALGLKIAKKALQRKRVPWPRIVLITDGRANIGLEKIKDGTPLPLHEEVLSMAKSIGKENHIRSLVLDTEEKQPAALGMAREIARRMNARRVPIHGLQPKSIVEALLE
ncbi:Mg-chelatase subunit ChlI-like protein [Desulfatibacillum aliphaticivorans]|uniref:Mg-chelatase subunit ChlI-like protein n=1 Tax=Desulfatibacillum aliphaticivorans TaxID=218208 RepID=B8FKC6_DESAL|nr:Mg-chelatase subunit ChlI-like protein [Desulfatibacillum aliphaticivorans]ACL01741.1 Mg-chelatase subunit ChlI-like protein [Desulfatibacillum aliphaticivorans]